MLNIVKKESIVRGNFFISGVILHNKYLLSTINQNCIYIVETNTQLTLRYRLIILIFSGKAILFHKQC